MYLAIDVGATKTLLGVFSEKGKLIEKQKIPTNENYQRFLASVKTFIKQVEFHKLKISACCCAIAGKVDRKRGVGVSFGNLDWKNVPIRSDLKKILPKIPIFVENDANIAGLFEASRHKNYRKVLYLTFSTGVGSGFIVDGRIEPSFADAEVGHMVLEHEGKLQKWEDFASGRALVQRFGLPAEALDNPFAWKAYAKDIARGLDILLATLQPDLVIIGGSVGAHMTKFSEFLKEWMKKISNQMVSIPPIIKADKAEEAVIYGCYEYIRQQIRQIVY